MAEMTEVGAIAGHLLISTLVSGALATGSEIGFATVEADSSDAQQALVSVLQRDPDPERAYQSRV
jgi:hypothetical protein